MRCLRHGCLLEAWRDGDARSHFCVRHAWNAAKAHLLLNEHQRTVFNQDFTDYLVPEYCIYGRKRAPAENVVRFSVDDAVKLIRTNAQHCYSRATLCLICSREICSMYLRCGACRVRLGLPEEERTDVKAMCQHWRAEPGPGHFFLRNCEKEVPIDRLALMPNGEKWCGGCKGYIFGIDKTSRLQQGYGF